MYALHKGGTGAGAGECGDVTAFQLEADGRLSPIEGSRRSLSAPVSNPAQVGISPDRRTLVVTEEATSMIGTWPLDPDGGAGTATSSDSARKTPFGFAFTRSAMLVVANAEEGGSGPASVSSYLVGEEGVTAISGVVLDLRSEVCWTVLSQDEQFAYVTNVGDGTVSSYTRGLYAIDVASRVVHGWALRADGALVPVGSCAGLPATAAGLAAL